LLDVLFLTFRVLAVPAADETPVLSVVTISPGIRPVTVRDRRRLTREVVMPTSDAQIIASVLGGDREAYRHLVERYQDRVFGVLLRLIGDRDLAEDAAQEAFVKAYLALPRFRGESAFGTWLVQIAIHAARDRVRRQQRRRQVETTDEDGVGDVGGTARDALTAIVLDEDLDRLQRALQQLPDDYREVLVLKHLEEWSFEEIAGHAQTSVGSLKVRAHRARRLLRQALEDLAPPPRRAARAAGAGED
jgi:RNA polymerase sigma-70 factor, ECF subfamily